MVPHSLRCRVLSLAALAVFLVSGCRIIGPDDDSRSVSFHADQDLYDVQIIEGTQLFLDFDIRMEIRNDGDRDLALLGCIKPSMPILQKRVDDDWVTVYAVAEPACLSPPWFLEPGDVYRDTLRVEAELETGILGVLVWESHIPVNGEYRLERGIYEGSEGEDWPTILPLEERVSASFLVRVHRGLVRL